MEVNPPPNLNIIMSKALGCVSGALKKVCGYETTSPTDEINFARIPQITHLEIVFITVIDPGSKGTQNISFTVVVSTSEGRSF